MSQDRLRVLLIGNDAAFATSVGHMLGQAHNLSAEVRSAADLKGGLTALGHDEFHVVLMDLSVPDGAGLGNVSLIKAEAPQLPIIVAGDADDEAVALQAVQAGAHDYVVKNQLNPGWLERSIKYAIERHRLDRVLLAAEQKYHSVFDHLVEGIFQTTPRASTLWRTRPSPGFMVTHHRKS